MVDENFNSKLLQIAKKNLDAFGNELGKQLGAAIAGEDGMNSALDKVLALADLKSKTSTTVIYGKDMTIPNEVYEKFAEGIYEKIKGNIRSGEYSTKDSTLASLFLNSINTPLGSIEDVTVTLNVPDENNQPQEVTYNINFMLDLNLLGQSIVSANVSDGTNSAQLTMTMGGKKSFAQYCAALFNLEEKISDSVLKQCFDIFTSGAADLLKAIYSSDSPASEVKNFVDASKKELKTKIKNALQKDSPINGALTKYGDLTELYNDLADEISSSKSTVKSISKATEKFSNAAEKLDDLFKNYGLDIGLSTLPEAVDPLDPYLQYNKNMTAVVVTSEHGNKLEPANYNKKVKKIDASAYAAAIEIVGNTKANKIYGGLGDDTLSGGKGNDSLLGGEGKDLLFGEAGNDKLFGNAGDDILVGGAGADILTGGDGADIFYYSDGDGKDTITDYTAGEDKISLAGDSIDKITMSGRNVVFKIGRGSIKVKNAKNKEITIVTADNVEEKYFNGELVSENNPWFMEDTTSDSGDLDALMSEVPTNNYSAENLLSKNSDELLSGATFAQASDKNNLAE